MGEERKIFIRNFLVVVIIVCYRVTVGRAAVHNAKSIKLVNDIDLHHQPVDKENAPMLIVGFGKTFTIHDQAPKKLIMKTLARAAMENDQVMIMMIVMMMMMMIMIRSSRRRTPTGSEARRLTVSWCRLRARDLAFVLKAPL